MAIEIGTIVDPGQENAFTVGDRHAARSLSELPESHRALLDGAVTAAVSTLNGNGSMQLTPIWTAVEGDRLLLNSVRGRAKDRNLRARPQVTVLLMDPQNPYHWLSVQGTVEEIVDEDDPERGQEATDTINRLSQLYLGEETYPLRDPNGEVRTLYKVAPRRILVFGQPSDDE